METRQQRLIREALGHRSRREEHEDEAPNASLQDKSLEHTDPDYLPKTLTPFEWEEFYEEHGVPPAHRGRAKSERDSSKRGLLRRIFGR
jgi:hypothetical protein